MDENPTEDRLLSSKKYKLSAEEKAFINNFLHNLSNEAIWSTLACVLNLKFHNG